ncbi:hypothetical protein PLESTB_000396100 [Pleodorina starrii]|uniref:Sugar phosphate transporter domain-containing protein n=1 Tax=Pleodorina starrii TaxID=330485 RepID=A0A9W6BEG2_9CHLO|nr:hypothetical protein PLESTM_001492100 [Pleodorina starrii]GLC50584.1 hypothetical protein PLESTB_000396100 [Pleodorina starrii]GLC73178.1 hypothetical protein PLESTF_001343800 [Pleodorina starrii]
MAGIPVSRHVSYSSVATSEISGIKTASYENPQRKWFEALGACLLWLTCSSSIILVNKYIMVDLGFSYPMAVAAMGMGFASVATFLYCDVLKRVPPTVGIDAKFYWTRIFPVGACQGLTLFLGNQMYFYLTVAFIEMSRASLPVTTMVALWLARLETPTAAVIRAVCVTAVGCAIAAYGEVHLTFIGALLAVSNLTMESVRLVMTQYLLVGCDMHPLQSLKYIAPAATLTLLAGSAVREYPTMVAKQAFGIVARHPVHFFMAAALGLVVNVLGVVIIKLSSATTLKVLAAVRGPIVVMCGVMLFAEAVTMIEFFGYSIALVGFIWYQYALTQRAAAEAAAKLLVPLKA